MEVLFSQRFVGTCNIARLLLVVEHFLIYYLIKQAK